MPVLTPVVKKALEQAISDGICELAPEIDEDALEDMIADVSGYLHKIVEEAIGKQEREEERIAEERTRHDYFGF